MVDAYPLAWPTHWPRTARPQPARFQTSGSNARIALMNELRLLGATNVVVSSNAMLRRDGYPYANQRIDEPGIAVYFQLNGEQQCIPCDKWNRLDDNIQAIRKTIEALRGLERWGAKEMVNAAFRGFKALPAAGDATVSSQKLWYEVLQVSPDADFDIIESAYKKMLHKVHPDKGGTDAEFTEVQNAWKQAKELRGKS